MQSHRSITLLWVSAAMAASAAGAVLSSGTALAASVQFCADTTSGSSTNGTALPVCVSQQGNVVTVTIGAAGGGSGVPAPLTTIDPPLAPAALLNPEQTRQRQAIRDRVSRPDRRTDLQ